MGKLEGKVAIVTGAVMGNGKGIAEVFAKYGATVVLADKNDQVFAAAADLRLNGYAAEAFQVDVTSFGHVRDMVDEVISTYGRIDILVNNAGVIKLRGIFEKNEAARRYQVDMKGVWNFCKAVVPFMQEQKYGKIVNLSSAAGRMSTDVVGNDILSFTKSLAREVAADHITCNCICPDNIAISNTSGDVILEGLDAIPMHRPGKLEEVGELAAFLSSDESNYVTGNQIVIDGGSTLPEMVAAGV